MNKVDKIEIYTEVSLSNAIISEHSIDQALDRFNLKDKARIKVSEWIRKKLEYATFKSTVNSEKYGIARLFTNQDIALVVDIHKDVVMTVYKLETRPLVKGKIRDFMLKEKNKINRIYNKKKRSYSFKIAELNIEKAILQRDLLRTRSQTKHNEMLSKTYEIDASMSEMMKELCDLQDEKSEFEISIDTI